jgi:hypothetical protein
MSDLPPNIREFNFIVGLMFNQLYEVFPVIVVCGWFAASRPCTVSLTKWVYRNELANNSSGVGYDLSAWPSQRMHSHMCLLEIPTSLRLGSKKMPKAPVVQGPVVKGPVVRELSLPEK